MLKKKVKNLQEYYYQWMCKHKDDADRRLGLLKSLEWAHNGACPSCYMMKGEGHADDCELAAELAQAQADEYIESEDAHVDLEGQY